MSLRAEMHTAIDAVAPPAPMLASRVEAFVLADDKDRHARPVRGRRWTMPFRGMTTVLAAVLVVLLIAGMVLGGRLWRDWNSTVHRPTPINHTLLKQLESRPLTLPVVASGAACPFGPLVPTPFESALGPLSYGDGLGPLYAEGSGQRYVTSWGTYFLTGYAVKPPFAGLILIRARDLQTNQVVVFANDPNFKGFQPATPTGEMVGTDFLFDQKFQRYTELAMQPENMYQQPGFWQGAGTLQGFPAGASGCVGFQVDGADFTEHFVVSY